MSDTGQYLLETLSEPLDDILFAVGKGLAAAQMELDRNSQATQIMIDNDSMLKESGIEAPWYHFQETNIEIKLSISMHWQEVRRSGMPSYWKFSLQGAPHNPAFQDRSNSSTSGSSTVSARIVSVPSQRPIQEGG